MHSASVLYCANTKIKIDITLCLAIVDNKSVYALNFIGYCCNLSNLLARFYSKCPCLFNKYVTQPEFQRCFCDRERVCVSVSEFSMLCNMSNAIHEPSINLLLLLLLLLYYCNRLPRIIASHFSI